MKSYFKKISILAAAVMLMACSSKGPAGNGGGGQPEEKKMPVVEVTEAELEADGVYAAGDSLSEVGLKIDDILIWEIKDGQNILVVEYSFHRRYFAERYANSPESFKDEMIAVLQSYIDHKQMLLAKYGETVRVRYAEDDVEEKDIPRFFYQLSSDLCRKLIEKLRQPDVDIEKAVHEIKVKGEKKSPQI
ncbi:MAG: hypothetical protein AB1540_02390 [Bdellovibrionota bacterium]